MTPAPDHTNNTCEDRRRVYHNITVRKQNNNYVSLTYRQGVSRRI